MFFDLSLLIALPLILIAIQWRLFFIWSNIMPEKCFHARCGLLSSLWCICEFRIGHELCNVIRCLHDSISGESACQQILNCANTNQHMFLTIIFHKHLALLSAIRLRELKWGDSIEWGLIGFIWFRLKERWYFCDSN